MVDDNTVQQSNYLDSGLHDNIIRSHEHKSPKAYTHIRTQPTWFASHIKLLVQTFPLIIWAFNQLIIHSKEKLAFVFNKRTPYSLIILIPIHRLNTY